MEFQISNKDTADTTNTAELKISQLSISEFVLNADKGVSNSHNIKSMLYLGFSKIQNGEQRLFCDLENMNK